MHQIISINIQWISNVERNEEVFDIQTKTHLLWHIYNQYQTIWSLLVPGLECWPPRPGPSPSSPPPSPSWPGWRSRRRSPGAAGPPPVHRTVLYMRDERGHAVIMFIMFISSYPYDCPQGWKYCCSLLHTASAHQKPGRIWGLLKTLCVLTADSWQPYFLPRCCSPWSAWWGWSCPRRGPPPRTPGTCSARSSLARDN